MWEVTKNGRTYYCIASGGYVVVGSRSKPDLSDNEAQNCSIEQFLVGTHQEYVKKNMGDAILKEILVKVALMVEKRNKKPTSGPMKD